MMGPYYYYDTAEDIPQFHDCMWSGECYSSHTTLVTYPAQIQQQQQEPIWPPQITLIQQQEQLQSHQHNLQQQQQQQQQQQHFHLSPLAGLPQVTPTKQQEEQLQQQQRQQQQRQQQQQQQQQVPVKKVRHKVEKKNQNHHHHHHHHRQHRQHQQVLDNKKLRHREVEKNRHRQLQAMVKTLSDQIPGKLDKETQVQTMKRAARYCIFLREIVSLLLSKSGTTLNKDKIENFYVQSCNRVDLMS